MKKKIILLFTFWRIALFIPIVAGFLFLSPRPGYHYTLVPFFTKTFNPINHFLLSPWGNFDGIYYLFIASRGYTVEAGFFPLFPLLIRFVSFFFGGFLAFDPRQYLIANLLVNAAFVAGLYLFYRLILIDYQKPVAWQSVVYVVSFPTAFFFAAVYSESVFFLLAMGAFLWARKRQWLGAGVLGALLSATRPVGIAILPALLFEWYVSEWRGKRSLVQAATGLVSVLLSSTGFLSYIWFNVQKWGNPLFFMNAQEKLQQNRSVHVLINPLQTLFRYIKIFVTFPITRYEWWIAFLEFSSFIVSVILLFVAWKKGVRPSYILFALVCLFLPALTGTFNGLPRYVLVLFPLSIATALWVKKKVLRYGLIALGFAVQGILLALFSRGYFVA